MKQIFWFFLGCVASCWLFGAAAQAGSTPVCSKAVKENFALGVNAVNLGWRKDAGVVIKDINEAGARHIRMTLVPPFSKTIDTLLDANRNNLDILAVFPMSIPQHYPADAQPRSGGGKLRDVRRLSNLDPGLFERVAQSLITEMENRGVRLKAIEFGNEINWSDFNGDMPMTGREYDIANFKTFPESEAIEVGIKKYSEALGILRGILKKSKAYRNTQVISAGLADRLSKTMKAASGSVLQLDLVTALFKKYSVLGQIDGYAVHMYPSETSGPALVHAVDAATRACRASETGLPCWITEWGFGNLGDSNHCIADDSKRLESMRNFNQAVACVATQRKIQATYLFDFEQSPFFSVKRCGRLLESGRIFAR